jgi:aspartate aminotransferase
MTGWRIGYCAGNEKIIKAASALQDHTTSNPNSIAQKAALAALVESEKSKTAIAAMREEYRRRRDYMVMRLQKMKGISVQVPDGAFYVFPDVSKLYRAGIGNSVELSAALLEKARIAVIPGERVSKT